MFHFYTPWKHKKTVGFRVILGGIEVELWLSFKSFHDDPELWKVFKLYD